MLAFAGKGAEVAFHLDAVPEGVGLAEKNAEADRHCRSDGPLVKHDLVDRPRRHADGAGHGVLRDAHGLEIVLQQDFAGGDGHFYGYNVWRYGRGSMVIHDGDLDRPRIRPAKDDAPLAVDPDGVKTGVVHLNEFSEGDPADGRETFVGFRAEQFFGIAVSKGLDHGARSKEEAAAGEEAADIMIASSAKSVGKTGS